MGSTAEQPVMWAVFTPDGRLTWYPRQQSRQVKDLVGGEHGATDSAWVQPPLRLLAGDVSALYPQSYAANPLAERVVAELSGGRLQQSWRGVVALVEYEQDTGPGSIGEWLWPIEMSPEWMARIEAAVAGAAEASTEASTEASPGSEAPAGPQASAEHAHAGFEVPGDPLGRPVDTQLLGQFVAAAVDACTSCQDALLTLMVQDAATTARLVELACVSTHAKVGGLPPSLTTEGVPGPAAPAFRRLARAGVDGANDALFAECEQLSEAERREAANTAADIVIGNMFGLE